MTRQKDNPIQKLLGEKTMHEVEFFALTCLKISFGEKFCNTYVGGVAPKIAILISRAMAHILAHGC
jgi:hypothetical protein